jgi:zinc transport system ATP-binding protein
MSEVVALPKSEQAPTLLELDDVCVARGGRDLLEHIDLRLSRGQILTVIGPNGAGKSTLAKAALGLIDPDSGAVTRAAGAVVGYVPQHMTIDPTLPMTVGRFLKLARRGPNCLSPAEALDYTQVRHLIGAQLQTLSGGEFRRVLLARALLRRPDLLVLDEPDQGLDVHGRNELYKLISRLADELGCGVLMISHDLHFVMSATDEVLCLNHHVCCHGQPDAVSEHPEYRRLFGVDATALALYHHHHDHSHDIHGDVRDQDGETR